MRSSRFFVQLVAGFRLGAEVAWEGPGVVVDGSAAEDFFPFDVEVGGIRRWVQ